MRRPSPIPGLARAGFLFGALAFLNPAAVAAQSSHPVTFNDVAPVLFKNCGVCHHEGGSGPFNLLTYQEVRKARPADRVGD